VQTSSKGPGKPGSGVRPRSAAESHSATGGLPAGGHRPKAQPPRQRDSRWREVSPGRWPSARAPRAAWRCTGRLGASLPASPAVAGLVVAVAPEAPQDVCEQQCGLARRSARASERLIEPTQRPKAQAVSNEPWTETLAWDTTVWPSSFAAVWPGLQRAREVSGARRSSRISEGRPCGPSPGLERPLRQVRLPLGTATDIAVAGALEFRLCRRRHAPTVRRDSHERHGVRADLGPGQHSLGVHCLCAMIGRPGENAARTTVRHRPADAGVDSC
jgi:hypothetical protein